ncbi:MAG TPA: hypothetical protein ACFYD4_06205 [Candidatus Wunengus sp. YC61]|uniref:hypothetical protein n=1 Tax=Candidatus Wunengus sp. YC61 TaxID=3367698 RepID=UPI004027F691
MREEEVLIYLKTSMPHLYDYEMAIREVSGKTGFGSVSSSVTLRYGKVEVGDAIVIKTTKTRYRGASV